jgi:hypothetical protein
MDSASQQHNPRLSDAASDEHVAVLIVNRNKKDYLLRAIECVRASSYPHVETFVADDCSTDGSVDAVRSRYPTVTVLSSDTRRGAPGIRNDGIRIILANPDIRYVLFLDNDAFVQPDAIGQLVDAIRREPRIGVVAPKAFRNRSTRLLYSAGELRVNLYTGIVRDVGAGEVDSGQHDTPRDIQSCASFAMLVRREVLEETAGFDEAFFPYGWEDVEFTLRARRHGYRIRYAPSAEVEHLGGKPGRGVVLDYEIAKTKNLFRLMARHATLFQWICFIFVLPFRAISLVFGRISRLC